MGFICSLPVIANLFTSCAAVPPLAVGYVEGEHVLLSSVDIAAVKSLVVKRGDTVGAGDILAVLEDSDARNSVAEAEAALAQAQDQLANLKEGKRPEEIGVLQAALNSALAETNENERIALRLAGLAKHGVSSQADVDQANTRLDLSLAKVAQAEANLAVAKLPARENEIRAAEQQGGDDKHSAEA